MEEIPEVKKPGWHPHCECDNFECLLLTGMTYKEYEEAGTKYDNLYWYVAHPSHGDKQLSDFPVVVLERNERYVLYTIPNGGTQ